MNNIKEYQKEFDEIQAQVFEGSIASLLRENGLPDEAINSIPKALSRTFTDVKKDLDIRYPIVIRSSDLLRDHQFLLNQDSNSINFARLVVTFVEGRVARGELVMNERALVAYSKIASWKKGRVFTPWKLITDIAHELKHGEQYQNDHTRVSKDQKNPYDAQIVEYEANDYALRYIHEVKPRGIMDRIERAFVLLDLKNDLKRNIARRMELGLE